MHACMYMHPYTYLQDVTFVSWSKTGDYLALGTGKGTMCIYHRRTNEKVKISHSSTVNLVQSNPSIAAAVLLYVAAEREPLPRSDRIGSDQIVSQQ